MKKAIKILLFWVAVVLTITSVGGNPLQFIDVATIVSIVVIAGSLLFLSYKKGMKKSELMIKLKKYIIFAGYLSFLIFAVLILNAGIKDVEGVVRNFAVDLLSIIWAYIFAYIIDALYIKD